MAKKSPKTNDSVEKIIGRVREQDLLMDLINSKKSEFIAVYGRRRVGKTYLIKNFVSSLPCVFFHVTGLQNGTSKEQQEEFSKQIGVTFYKGASMAQRERWRDAFEDLTKAIEDVPKDKTVVLFFDEFPWMLRHEVAWKSCLQDETMLAVA